jgi:serine O-acetyltransferase
VSEPIEQPFPANIEQAIDALQAARRDWRSAHDRHAELGVHFPSRRALRRIMRDLIAALFPLRFGPPKLTVANENAYVGATLETTLDQLASQLILEFDLADLRGKQRGAAEQAIAIITWLTARLGDIRRLLDCDIRAAYHVDPAAGSVDEVLLSYPSVMAIIHHRVAHALHAAGSRIVARAIAEIAHRQTGIDIHPGAEIGEGLFIDHGTGLVIGETAVLGRNVHLHQGVTIGGLGQGRSERRHAWIGDDVRIYPGAVLLGPINVGARSVIDANVVLRQDVPEDMVVRAPPPDIISNLPDH